MKLPFTAYKRRYMRYEAFRIITVYDDGLNQSWLMIVYVFRSLKTQYLMVLRRHEYTRAQD
jgi:hypothetical protein